MGFYDELGDDDDRPLESAAISYRRELDAPQLGGLALLRAERAAGSLQLVRWGALGARLEAIGPGAREAWALLNLDRIMRRVLASADIEPSEMLGPLLGGTPAPIGRGGELSIARFLLCALLQPISRDQTPEGVVAARLLTRLRPGRTEDLDDDAWAQEQLAIDGVTLVVDDVIELFGKAMTTTDPMFAVTDVLSIYGGALHNFPLDHMPNNEGASRGEILLESFRTAATLPRPLERLLSAVPDGGLLAVFDVAAGLALFRQMPPAPLLTGLIRRDLFRRDLHYPADLGSLFAALRVALIAAERDLATVEAWRRSGSRAAGRVQLMARASLACLGSARTAALATIAGTTWQGLQAGLAGMGPALLTRAVDGWELREAGDRL